MEVDEVIKSVLAAPGTTGSVTISLHPLVIMNVSEHWTRVKAQEGQPLQGKSSYSLLVTMNFNEIGSS